MKVERAIKSLQEVREQAVMLEKMYREDVIPKAHEAVASAISSCVDQQQTINEIDRLIELANE